ncbi:hypothetical protein DFQ28_011083 [Apophysomyces sp. BC1034]|nr:hypothetical protein DFQ30_010869 [Apophysomyces sp. BC1015]KAG0169700.1 hypothetical protein DFQ29_009577 [Apophysomyces sp. BC1021]KAG0184471.1 hypothetical protein DFQ28_011083 [Apophysomyces sp. BC1034]
MTRTGSFVLGIAALGTCVLHNVLANVSPSPPVDLTLVAPWAASDLLVEIAEVIGAENDTSYFELVGDLLAISPNSPKQIYQDALDVAYHRGHVTTQRSIDIVKLGLSLHVAAPRIEAYHQFYNQTIIPTIASYDTGCPVWAQVDQIQICDVAHLEKHIKAFEAKEDHTSLLPFDHVLRPKEKGSAKTVILYTHEFSSTFAKFHDSLMSFVEQYSITYIIRYKPSSNKDKQKPLYLSGYGVELALKNTDYLVIDDRAAEGMSILTQKTMAQLAMGLENDGTSKRKSATAGKKISQALFENPSPSIEPLTPTEIKDLGSKAAQLIAMSSDPLTVLAQLSQDFPKYAKSLSDTELDEQYADEIRLNQASVVQPGMNAIWFNGLHVESEKVDPFYLVRVLQHEGHLIDSLKNLGFTRRQAIDFLTQSTLTEDGSSDAGISDVYDVRESSDNKIAIWWNDLEKDKRYKGWSDSLFDLLRPVYPGQLRAIKRNIYSLLMIEKITSADALLRIKDDVQSMVKNGTPIRFGLIPILGSGNDADTMAAKILNHLVIEHGKASGMDFLTKIHEQLIKTRLEHASEAEVKRAFETLAAVNDKILPDLESVLGSQDVYESTTKAFLKRMGIAKEGESIMFLNGKLLEFSKEKPWKRVLMNALQEQNQIIARDLYFGKLSPDGDVYEHLLSQPYVSGLRNPYITVSENWPLRMLTLHEPHSSLSNLRYFTAVATNDTQVNTNLWVIANFDSSSGIKLALETLAFIDGNEQARVSFIHNPSDKPYEYKSAMFSDLLYQELYEKKSELSDIKQLLVSALEDESKNTEFADQTKPLVPGSPIVEIVNARGKKWQYLREGLIKSGLEEDFNGLVMNGRVVGPLPLHVDFLEEDLGMLFRYETEKRIGPAQKAIEEIGVLVEKELLADVVMQSALLINADKESRPKTVFDSETQTRMRNYKSMKSNLTKVVTGNQDDAFLEIGVIVDPLSETAQKWSVLLERLSTIDGVYIEMYLNPDTHLEEIPLKQFYRYVFDREPHFDSTTGALEAPTAYFADLPMDALYTLGVDTIKSWHVTVKEANMDLDNIRLTTLGGHPSVSAVYELERILIEGHCVDSATQGAPRGLQFVLGTESNPATTDTIVMANLGYFQLKASPGVWELALREGRSSQVYHIESVGTEGKWEKENQKKVLALTSFEGLTVFPQVKKNAGMEDEDVLAAEGAHEDNSSGFWSSLTNRFFGNEENKAQAQPAPKQADINIFSVASGQLYERFMSIMIASVMEHTESTVKFWFIENFLSPSFKDFVPEMAKEYGFEYEMVTYKWPSWLRSQKEKQRTIWGYKVLFLDVLFPLDLDKVIFVDADQIVRTDMKELVNMDLQGAPYGYTPFCSDRTEMDGFRFWTQGYWKEHLQEKPYHISALYVVDLVRFRELAAGDRLRAQYQQLSADPNSLANLDQDLPNNMQHIVPIHSLPQEWLWCETWCSDESLKTAKTIDLCNNPLTKEPKLDRARRQVPEWEKYDDQIHELRKKIAARASEASSNNKQDGATQKSQGHRLVDEL